jgi:hypothetical protein
MRQRFIKLLVLLGLAVLVAPVYAQQTGLSGVVKDTQGDVIAGATIEARLTGGSSFSAKSNGQGAYVLPSVTAGEYTITITAPNFATVQKKILLLVGQLAEVDMTLPLATANSLVVVEASDDIAIDTTTSVVAGNVTPNEVQDVPINGRNYMGLAQLIPGIKANALTDAPVSGGDAETGKFQVTLDGMQVSQDSVGSSFGQPRFSQDAIAQFQIITNRFDATAGRSAGLYVNLQSKAGVNAMHGGAFGYFRNSYFSAADPILKRNYILANNTTSSRVTSFSDQQYGGTLGGAIKRDNIWYFGSYEGEHQPNTYSSVPSIPLSGLAAGATFTHPTLLTINEYLGRVDYQLNEKNHIFVRGDGFTYNSSYDGAGDPSSASTDGRSSYGYTADWNRAVSGHFINDLHAAFHYFKTTFLEVYDSPVLQLPSSITVGAPYNRPETFTQPTQQYRDDIYWIKGKHALKVGGEFLYLVNNGYFGQNVRGSIACTNFNPSFSTAQAYAAIFPKGTTDSSTWNYTWLSQNCVGAAGSTTPNVTYVQGFGNFTIHIPRKVIGVWAQDDWKILPRLTLNLGLRYDNDLGAFLNNLVITNGLLTPNTNPNANFQPRLGFAYDPMGKGKTSIRGGAGLYYADINANPTIDNQLFNGQTTVQATLTNPTNLANPFQGQDPASNPGAYVTTPQFLARGASTPYSLQASFGVAHELGWKTSMTADVVHTRTYKDFILLNGNLLVNPANPQQNLDPTAVITPANYASRICGNGATTLDTYATITTQKNLCNQHFGGASTGTGGNRQFTTTNGAGNLSDALQVGIKHATTKGFTAGLAWTWSRTKNSTNGAFSYPNKPFISGIQQEWANGTDDQRHTVVVTSQYEWKYGLMISGLYHFGSGLAASSISGNSGVNGYSAGTRTFAANTQPIAPGQTCPVAKCVTIYAPMSKVYYDAGYGYWIIQRDAIRGTPYHRMDVRLQEAVHIKEKYQAIVGMEAFNLLNHANYSSFGGTATSPSTNVSTGYGIPTAAGSSTSLEYLARNLQFFARLRF